jgi:hypothetical protein
MFTLTIVLVAIAVVIAGILLFVASKPDKFEYKRSATINAPSDRIFPFLNDLREHLKWSPFEKDPDMKRVHSGALQGKGSMYEWDGNREVGAGRISIVDSTPSRITLDLQMTRPFACRNVVEFSLEPAGSGTTVIWAMRGAQPFIGKLMGLFIDCEKMCGSQFEIGLARLKSLAEAGDRSQAAA